MNRNAVDVASIAKQNADAIKSALKTKQGKSIAIDMGRSPSVVSDLKDADIEKHASLAAACGYKYVPAEYKYYPPDLVDALLIQQRYMLEVVTEDRLAKDQ